MNSCVTIEIDLNYYFFLDMFKQDILYINIETRKFQELLEF